MAQDLERIQARLNNISTVGPILAALRTISLGSWQLALNRVRNLQAYSERLLGLLPVLLPHLEAGKPAKRFGRLFARNGKPAMLPEHDRSVALVIGSERGLCGRYNAVVYEHAERYADDVAAQGGTIEWMALGARMVRAFQRDDRALAWSQGLPVTRLPAFEVAHTLTRAWLRRYEAHEVDAVDVVYNGYEGAGRYAPAVVRLLPPQLPPVTPATGGAAWVVPVIVETDPLHLSARVVEQWIAVSFYNVLLSAAAAEHSARFHLMESATQNAERLVEELTLELQSARRQAITREMQELAAGAGLLET